MRCNDTMYHSLLLSWSSIKVTHSSLSMALARLHCFLINYLSILVSSYVDPQNMHNSVSSVSEVLAQP